MSLPHPCTQYNAIIFIRIQFKYISLHTSIGIRYLCGLWCMYCINGGLMGPYIRFCCVQQYLNCILMKICARIFKHHSVCKDVKGSLKAYKIINVKLNSFKIQSQHKRNDTQTSNPTNKHIKNKHSSSYSSYPFELNVHCTAHDRAVLSFPPNPINL